MTRPSESISATVGVIVGATVALLAAYGIAVPPAAVGPIVTLVSFVAAGVTWYIARKQRAGELGSAVDGVVQPLDTGVEAP